MVDKNVLIDEAYQHGYTTAQKEIEKERDELRADLNTAKQALEKLIPKYNKVRKEHLLLRAKVAEMERQEPVAWTTKLALEYGVRAVGFHVSGVNIWGERGVPLYTLPGAQVEEK